MALNTLSDRDLDILKDALQGRLIDLSGTPLALERLGIDVRSAQTAALGLRDLRENGFSEQQAATLVTAVIDARRTEREIMGEVELVVTGPDIAGSARDTRVVVDQLFSEVQRSILLVGFTLYDGSTLFKRLSARLDENPAIEALFCLDISRGVRENSREENIVSAFAEDFRRRHWTGQRFPRLFFDPRSLSSGRSDRSVLHAKCIVIDDRLAFVTSANPTPAAYDRNIEVGVVVRGGELPRRTREHFKTLIAYGYLKEVYL